MKENKGHTATGEALHDKVLRVAFWADSERPIALGTEAIYWKMEDPGLLMSQVREVLDWLVHRGDMEKDLGKYKLSRHRFFELKQTYHRVDQRGASIWLAPVAPIPIPSQKPAAPAPPAQPPGKVIWLAPVAPIPIPSQKPAAPAPPAQPPGKVIWLAPVAPISIPSQKPAAPATPAQPPGKVIWLAPVAPISIPSQKPAAPAPPAQPPGKVIWLAPVAPIPIPSQKPAAPATPAQPPGKVIWLAPVAPISIPSQKPAAPAPASAVPTTGPKLPFPAWIFWAVLLAGALSVSGFAFSRTLEAHLLLAFSSLIAFGSMALLLTFILRLFRHSNHAKEVPHA